MLMMFATSYGPYDYWILLVAGISLVVAVPVGMFAIVARMRKLARLCGAICMAHGIWALATLRDSSDTDSRNMLIFGLALLALGAVFVWLRRRPFPMDSRYLNMVAQGLLSYEESMATFERLRVSDQIRVLRALEFMAHQASAAADDVSPAIDAAHLPSDFRPAWTPKEPGVHISTDYRTIAAPDLPGQYQYLMKLFSIADGRRRKECGDHCSHWWHNLKKE